MKSGRPPKKSSPRGPSEPRARPAAADRAPRAETRAADARAGATDRAATLDPTGAGRAGRGPWALIALIAMIPLVAHSLGAPLGEPFADDFDYLKRVLLEGGGSFFDGGGAVLYWRPIARQIYFGLLGAAIVERPGVVAVLHGLLLALTTLLFYRAFRRCWSGPWSAAAAGFVLLGESTRMLIAWPSIFQDVGALFFIALAVHETAYRRLWSTLLAIVASLLCKEVAVLVALVVPWLPVPDRTPAERRRWAAATLATVAAWAIAYVAITRHAGLVLPHDVAPAVAPASWPVKLVWALGHSARAQFSLAAQPGRWDRFVALAIAALLAWALWRFAVDPAARRRLRGTWPWVAWGLAWFAAGVAPIAEVYPAWSPYRSVVSGVGFGVALLALLGPLGLPAIAALIALRLATFALSPGPPARIQTFAAESGAALDFPKLVRLERLARETRTVLKREFPTLPKGVRIGQRYLPQMTEYAFDGDKALQTWTRDSTARWIRFERFSKDLAIPLTTIVEYQPNRTPQIALVEPDAVRAMFAGLDRAKESDWSAALSEFTRSDSLQRHRDADVFIGMIAGKRAWVLSMLGRRDEAEQEARRALALWPETIDGLFLFAQWNLSDGHYARADSFITAHLRLFPADDEALELKRRIRAASQ